jgi:hypothetical protein
MAAAACKATAASFPRVAEMTERRGESSFNLAVVGVTDISGAESGVCQAAGASSTVEGRGCLFARDSPGVPRDATKVLRSAAFTAFAREILATVLGWASAGTDRSLTAPRPCPWPATRRIGRICPFSARALLCFIGKSPPLRRPIATAPRSPPITYRVPGGWR